MYSCCKTGREQGSDKEGGVVCANMFVCVERDNKSKIRQAKNHFHYNDGSSWAHCACSTAFRKGPEMLGHKFSISAHLQSFCKWELNMDSSFDWVGHNNCMVFTVNTLGSNLFSISIGHNSCPCLNLVYIQSSDLQMDRSWLITWTHNKYLFCSIHKLVSIILYKGEDNCLAVITQSRRLFQVNRKHHVLHKKWKDIW